MNVNLVFFSYVKKLDDCDCQVVYIKPIYIKHNKCLRRKKKHQVKQHTANAFPKSHRTNFSHRANVHHPSLCVVL